MKRIIKELKRNYEHELRCVRLTPNSDFKGSQKQYENYHKKRAKEYLDAATILSGHIKLT